MKSVPLSAFMAAGDGDGEDNEDRGPAVDNSPTHAQSGAKKWENVPKHLDLAERGSPAAQAEWAVGDTPPVLPPRDSRWEVRRGGPPADPDPHHQSNSAPGSRPRGPAGMARQALAGHRAN